MTGLVRPTHPASLAVEVGAELLELEPSHPVDDRIDLVCLWLGYAQVVTGTPSGSPVPPATPAGYLPIAHVRLSACASAVRENNITEVRP